MNEDPKGHPPRGSETPHADEKPTCTNPDLGRLLPFYEMGTLDPSEQEAFESHLLECDACFLSLYEAAPVTEELSKRREHYASLLAKRNSIARAKPGRRLVRIPLGAILRPAIAAAAAVVITVVVSHMVRSGPLDSFSRLSPQEIHRVVLTLGISGPTRALSIEEHSDLSPESRHLARAAALVELRKPREALSALEELKAETRGTKAAAESGHQIALIEALAYLLLDEPEAAASILESALAARPASSGSDSAGEWGAPSGGTAAGQRGAASNESRGAGEAPWVLEAHWLAAKAHMRLNRRARAARHLEVVAASRDPRAGEARRILDHL